MHDKGTRELINMYIDNELSDEARTKLERHLKECEECRLEYERLLKVHELSLLVEPTEPSPEALITMASRVRRRIIQERHERKKLFFPSFQVWPQVVSVAVVIFVACIGLLIIFRAEEGRFIAKKEMEEQKYEGPSEVTKSVPKVAVGAPKTEEKGVGAKVKMAEADVRITKGGVSDEKARPSAPAAVEPKSVAREMKRELTKEDKIKAGREVVTQPPAATGTVAAPESRAALRSEAEQKGFFDELAQAYDVGPTIIESVPVKVLENQDLTQIRRDVTVSVMIDSLGNVVDANMIRSSGNLRQDSAILNSVRQYRFQPAQSQNRRVRAQTVLRVQLKQQ